MLKIVLLLDMDVHLYISAFVFTFCLSWKSPLAGSNFRIEGSAFVRKLSKLKPRHFMLELVREAARHLRYTSLL